jgi:hypothetical protein
MGACVGRTYRVVLTATYVGSFALGSGDTVVASGGTSDQDALLVVGRRYRGSLFVTPPHATDQAPPGRRSTTSAATQWNGKTHAKLRLASTMLADYVAVRSVTRPAISGVTLSERSRETIAASKSGSGVACTDLGKQPLGRRCPMTAARARAGRAGTASCAANRALVSSRARSRSRARAAPCGTS